MIPRETVDKIVETARIEEVIQDFIPLKKAGANYKALSPFSNEKTPSFVVSPSKQIFKDFSSGKGGNVVSFIMEHEQYSYPEALRWLADKYHIEIVEEKQTTESIDKLNERESMFSVTTFAQGYFANQLLNTNKGKAIALSYFVERGFSEETITKFQLGYSPNQQDAMAKEALEQGYKAEYLEKAGLIKFKDNKPRDFFRGRVIFPIHNLTGKVVGFGGRILKSNDKAPKYLNSPESDIYNKSKVLYGIYFAKQEIVKNDNCFLVEGYTDVLSLNQSNVQNVVASSGTALTQGQILLIKRFTKNITILYDGDAAGIKASFRGIDLILQEGMNVKVVLFPDGDDPDSFAKKNSPYSLLTYITDSAQDFLHFKSHLLLKDTQDDPISKSKVIHDIIGSIALIPDNISRSIYIKQCSDQFELDEQTLLNELNKTRRSLKRNSQGSDSVIDLTPIKKKQQPTDDNEDSESLEFAVVRLLLHFGNNIMEYEIENKNSTETVHISVAHFIVQEFIKDSINFDNPVFQEIFNEFIKSMETETLPNSNYFINHPNPYISQITVDALSEKYQLSDNWKKKHNVYTPSHEEVLVQDVTNTVYAIKLKKIKSYSNQLLETLKALDEDTELPRINKMEEQTTLIIRKQKFDEIRHKLSQPTGRVIL